MMTIRRALAWALLLVLVAPLAAQARVADQAGLFSQDTIRQLDAADQQMQQAYGRGLLVVSVDDLNGRRWEDVAKQFPTSSDKGVYVFLVKNQKVLRVQQPRSAGIPTSRLDDIRNAILGGIRGGGFDKGILAGLPVIEDTYRSMGWSSAPGGAPQQRKSGGGINWMFILIVGVGLFFLFKMIGATRNRGVGPQAPGYGQPGYGQPGYGQPGYGPGYGQQGGGGGFMSGLLGGLGGAVAGNYLYDQFRGHGGGGQGSGHDVGGSYQQSDSGVTGGDYDYSGSSGGSWQDSGGAEADFGSGGGDWGGGGDSGGGGGDW